MRPLALVLALTFQMLIQMIDISDLGETLIILGLEAKIILLKMWFSLIIVLTTLVIIGVLVFSIKYGILMILRYDFD